MGPVFRTVSPGLGSDSSGRCGDHGELRTGVPQLVVPFSHDQYDNADRIWRLGCGRKLPRCGVTERSLERELTRLLSERWTATRAAEVTRSEAESRVQRLPPR